MQHFGVGSETRPPDLDPPTRAVVTMYRTEGNRAISDRIMAPHARHVREQGRIRSGERLADEAHAARLIGLG